MGVLAAGLVAGWLALAAVATIAAWMTLRLLRRPQPWPEVLPEVLVLVPVRGAGPRLDGFLAGLAAQDWQGWRVAFAVESADDPAHAVLARFVAAHPGRARLAVAGRAQGRGQKVQNLLAVLRHLRPDDAAVVTLDADILPPPDLLRELLRPLFTGQAAISTGYRWSLPAPGAGWAAQAVALIEAGLATPPRAPAWNICWGGACAIGRPALDALDLPRLWDRAMSDDLVLTRAARAAGLRIYAPLTVRPPSPFAGDARAALDFGTRQYWLVLRHLRGAWPLAGACLLLPLLGGAAALAAVAEGDPRALACLGLALMLHGTRMRLRGRIADAVLPPDAAATARLVLARGPWLWPAAGLLALAAWAGAALRPGIAWAGRRYRVDRDGRVTALDPA